MLKTHGVHGCSDVFVSAQKFLSNGLDVDTYYSLMHKARYALVPCGENAESYRLWEALHAGTIPIVETCGDPEVHPLRAMPGAISLLPTIWDWQTLSNVRFFAFLVATRTRGCHWVA
jgi:hypothetical protein